VLLVALAVLGGACSSDSGPDDAVGADDEVSTTATATSTDAAPATAEPLDDQTPPPSVNGLTVDGDVIWVTSLAGDEVLAVRRDDGAILERHPTDGAGPDDVAVAPDGSVWVTGFTSGELGRIADGSYQAVVAMEPGINP